MGSDGLRRLTNKSKPGITCEHASLLLLHALKLPHVHSQNHPASRYAHAAFTACVLLIWGSDGLRRLKQKQMPGLACKHASRASVSVSSAHGNVLL